MILAAARRSGRYSAEEVAQLAFEGSPPDAADLSARWASQLEAAAELIEGLPPTEVGRAVLDPSGDLFRGGPEELAGALASGELRFHAGAIRGTLPQISG
jgi:hypothetical protein